MNSYFKKSLCIVFCILILTSLAACVGEIPVGTSAAKGTTAATIPDVTVGSYEYTGEAPIAKEKVTISILTTNNGSKRLGFSDMTWWQEVLKKANVDLVMEEIDSSSYKDVILPRLAAATDLPDIVRLQGNDSDLAYANSGIFLELTEYYKKYGFNLGKQFEKNKGLKDEITTPDGKIYYVPYIYDIFNNSRCLMLNIGYLDALGMKEDDIKTLDDYYGYLVKVKNTDLNGNGDTTDEVPLFMRSGMINLWGMYWGVDITSGYQVEDDGTVICVQTDDRYLECLTYLNKLYTEGLLYNEFATANWDVQEALFTKNQIGSILHFISNCTSYSQSINKEWDFYKDDPIVMPIIPPKGPYGDQYVYGRDPLGTLYGITSECKNPDDAFRFMDYLYSQEVGELTWFGIEGTDYNVVGNEIEFTEKYLKNEEAYRDSMGYNFDGLPSYQMGEGYMATQCAAVRKMSNVLSEYALSPQIKFSYKLEDENEVLQAYNADLKTYFGENMLAFIMGTRPLSEWDEYVKTAEKMNLSEIVKVYQEVTDRAATLK
jgi:putative aldouronate transport system substrate-binding protein